MKDKLNINLRIADVVIPLSVNRSEEAQLRQTAGEINRVFHAYRERFKRSTDMEILAKVTLLFANGYLSQLELTKELDRDLSKFDSDLQSLIDGEDRLTL